MGAGAGGDFGNTKGKTGNVLDTISNFLTAASLIPGLDTFTDIASIPVDLLRKDWLSAGLDLAGVVPFVGEVADTANIARKADKIIDVTKTVNKVNDASKTVLHVKPSSLTTTHRLTLSKKAYGKLVEDIRKNGVKESIKYVEYQGKKYVVDGHHRLRAAKQLGLDNIPVEKVFLPYKGYKKVKDLLWFD